jgi:hypothetical protein
MILRLIGGLSGARFGTPYLAAPETRSTELHAWRVVESSRPVGGKNSLFVQRRGSAHNGLVGGSSPPGPTTQFDANRPFLVSAK